MAVRAEERWWGVASGGVWEVKMGCFMTVMFVSGNGGKYK